MLRHKKIVNNRKRKESNTRQSGVLAISSLIKYPCPLRRSLFIFGSMAEINKHPSVRLNRHLSRNAAFNNQAKTEEGEQGNIVMVFPSSSPVCVKRQLLKLA